MRKMSNSALVDYMYFSPNYSSRLTHKITKITIHHTAGVSSVEGLGSVFADKNRQGSANYGIGSDGRIGLYVDEKYRAWTSSSPDNDRRAVTIEVSNDSVGGNWHVSDWCFNRLIDLCVDICKRNGIKKLIFTGDASGNLTMHKYFAPTACPGPYLESKFPEIAQRVNNRLEEEEVTQEQFNEMMKNYLAKNTLKGYATEKQLAKAIDGVQTVDEYMDRKLGNKPSAYAKEAAAWAIDAGIFRGDGDGNYNWAAPIKREDVASVLYRDRYQTIADISDKESRDAIRGLVERRIIRGKGGEGDNMRIDLPKDIVRVLVYLHRAGVFE